MLCHHDSAWQQGSKGGSRGRQGTLEAQASKSLVTLTPLIWLAEVPRPAQMQGWEIDSVPEAWIQAGILMATFVIYHICSSFCCFLKFVLISYGPVRCNSYPNSLIYPRICIFFDELQAL